MGGRGLGRRLDTALGPVGKPAAPPPVDTAAAGQLIAGAMTGAMAGQSLQEHKQYSVGTEVKVPILQGVAAIVCLFLVGVGLWLMGEGLMWLVDLTDGVLPRVLAAVLLIVVSLPSQLAWRYLSSLREMEGRLASSLLAAIVQIAFVFLGLDLLSLVGQELDPWRLAQMFFGFALSLGCGLLVYRFVNEIHNWLYPKSPWIVLIEQLFDVLREQRGAEVRVIEPTPVRVVMGREPGIRVLEPYPIHVTAIEYRGEVIEGGDETQDFLPAPGE